MEKADRVGLLIYLGLAGIIVGLVTNMLVVVLRSLIMGM
jgi:hypothetical protein